MSCKHKSPKIKLKCFTLHVMNLEYMKVSLFEISKKKKKTFSRYLNFFRCTYMSPLHTLTLLQPRFKLLILSGQRRMTLFRHTISPSKYCKADIKPPSFISSWWKSCFDTICIVKSAIQIILPWLYIYTVGTESIQTPLNFSLFVILQPFAKII